LESSFFDVRRHQLGGVSDSPSFDGRKPKSATSLEDPCNAIKMTNAPQPIGQIMVSSQNGYAIPGRAKKTTVFI